MARDEMWDALKISNKFTRKGLPKNPDRIQFAIQQFEKHNIEYLLKNDVNGHFHCRRKSDDKLFQFWASTGTED